MSDYVLSCCSTADLSKEHMEQRDIRYICFHYELDGKQYADDLGQSMNFEDFYKAMENGADTRTSQVNAEEYEQYFETILKEGKDIIHLTLSSGISGSVNSAMVAKQNLEEKYPDRKLYIVDSLGASSGYGLIMDTLGRLIPRYKIRTKKKVIQAIVDKMIENAEGGTAYDGKCYISQSACYEDARAVADLVEKNFPNLKEPVQINWIGTTIGSHTGPGTVALFFWGRERVD